MNTNEKYYFIELNKIIKFIHADFDKLTEDIIREGFERFETIVYNLERIFHTLNYQQQLDYIQKLVESLYYTHENGKLNNDKCYKIDFDIVKLLLEIYDYKFMDATMKSIFWKVLSKSAYLTETIDIFKSCPYMWNEY